MLNISVLSGGKTGKGFEIAAGFQVFVEAPAVNGLV